MDIPDFEQTVRNFMKYMPSDLDGLEIRCKDLENAIVALQSAGKTKELRAMVRTLEKLKRETLRCMVQRYLIELAEQKAFNH